MDFLFAMLVFFVWLPAVIIVSGTGLIAGLFGLIYLIYQVGLMCLYKRKNKNSSYKCRPKQRRLFYNVCLPSSISFALSVIFFACVGGMPKLELWGLATILLGGVFWFFLTCYLVVYGVCSKFFSFKYFDKNVLVFSLIFLGIIILCGLSFAMTVTA